MFFKRLPTGMMSSNCYILGDAGAGAVIDPGVDCESIAKILKEQNLTLTYIILTHAHIDHILHMDELRNEYGGRIVIHEDDEKLLENVMLNGSMLFGVNKIFGKADLAVKDGDRLMLGDVELEVLHTPGHTPGSMCIRAGDSLFTGDTLFKMGIGRTDLGAGDSDKLRASLRRLMELDENIRVYPGHGSATTIGEERKDNMYLLY